jgi:hypothetical protein
MEVGVRAYCVGEVARAGVAIGDAVVLRQVAIGVVAKLPGRGLTVARFGQGPKAPKLIVDVFLVPGWRQALAHLTVIVVAVFKALNRLRAQRRADGIQPAAVGVVGEGRDGIVAEGFLLDEVALERGIDAPDGT